MPKKNITILFLSFLIVTLAVTAILNLIFGLIVHFFDQSQSIWWHILSPIVVILMLILILGSALFKSWSYQKNGQRIAKYHQAKKIEPFNCVPEEALAFKINLELAESCNVYPAHLFVFDRELGINALTVGYAEKDVSIILTWGALQSMNQDELKGMLAHEYSHIIAKDYIEHTQLEVFLSGFLLISQLGSYFIVRGTKHKTLLIDSIFAAIYVALGGFIWLLGSLGVIASRILKFIIFYYREFKTDLAACELVDQQYLLHALTRIYVHDQGSHIYRTDGESIAHYCFANALSEQSWFKIHPSLSRRINYLHPNFSRIAVGESKPSEINWQNLISKLLLPTNEEVLLDALDAQHWQLPQQRPYLRLSPISFTTKDAVRALSPEIRQSMERPELLLRAMQTATGCREVIVAIFMIRQYREFIPEDAQVSQAIIEALLKVDGRVHIQIFYEALRHIDNMPTIASRQFINRISQIIQADGEIGLLDCLLLERVKATQNMLDDALIVSKKHCTEAIVHLVDAILHVQQINSHNQLRIHHNILKRILMHDELQHYTAITDQPLDLSNSLRLISGLLVREKLYLLSVIEHELWSERVITQDELDVLELLYWRLGFETQEVVNRMLKQSSLLIL
ncbi:M48 family metallopeptidase [Acinetobacter puyangensis]|uniref:M48 family metallopeptidase n=1 Tax=Acinetobacter puyangensis TaxID=1096779 RepID=UPI003A4DB30A